MKKYAIIVAGGLGNRMGGEMPKQFLCVNGKPVLYYSIKAFLEAYNDMEVIVVLPELFIAAGQEIVDAYFDYDRIKFCSGGAERFHSVQNGLALVASESIIMVHDAARCMITTTLIRKIYEAACAEGGAIPAVTCTDSVRLRIDAGTESIERENVLLVQTPQAFHSKILIPAFNIDYKPRFTDEASVVESFGMKINIVEGEKENIKVTTPGDLKLAEVFLS